MAEISRITLPSGNTYDIKDATARQMISGGVSFIVAWDGTSTPVPANIPAGVKVTYGDPAVEYTGTLTAETEGADPHAQAGAFYLVKSSTSTTGSPSDVYDEYVPVGTTGSKFWEKIGDTQVDLSDVVTGVSLTKSTDTVIGSDATFTVTQPTITLAEDSSTGVTFVRGGTSKYMAASASGTAVTPSTTNIKATASGGGAAWNDKDSVTAVTGYPNATSDTFVKSVSAETNKNLVTTTIKPTNGTETVSKVTKTASKLVTTSVPNVTGNTDVSVPNITGNSSVTANKSTWTFTMGTGDASETLIIGGGNGNDVSATNTVLGTANTASKVTLGTAITAATGAVDANGTGSDIVTGVTISDKTVAKEGSEVTVATGSTATDGTGDAVVTGVTVGTSATAITGLGTPSTKSAIGASATFTNTQPTVALATGATAGTGVISVATGISSVTQPTITLSAEDSTAAGRAQFIQSVDTSKKLKGTASSGNVEWNSKDQVTVLTNATDVSVTKGNA